MIISRRAIPRRTMLRGMGAMLALPLLDSMVPALSALQKTAGKPVNRFGVFYVPNGMIMKNYLPTAVGANYELTPTLSALAPYRDEHARRQRAQQPADARAPGRRACQGQHAVPHQRVAADERDLARRRHLDGSDSRQRRPASTRSCRRSSCRWNRARLPARATRATRARTPARSSGRAPTRRCRRRTTRAWSSSGCSAMPRRPIRKCGWRACGSSAACSIR